MTKIITLPNGKLAEVDDDISRETLRKIMDENRPKPGSSRPQTRVAAREEGKSRSERSGVRDFIENAAGVLMPGSNRSVRKGALLGFADEITGAGAAATKGVVDAVRKGDISAIKDEYVRVRDIERQLDKEYEEANPVASTVYNIQGSMANPVGTTGRTAQAVAGGLSRVGMRGAGQMAGRVAARIAKSPVLAAAATGAKQGAVNAVGNSEADNVADLASAAVEGASLGGAAGGVLGGAIKGGSAVNRVLKDRRANRAEEVAYEHIEQMLSKGEMTPEQAAVELRGMQQAGSDARVMDVLPSMNAEAMNLSRKPELRGSNKLIEFGEDRIATRPERFTQRVDELTGNQPDALTRGDSIEAGRSAAGNADYPAVLDKNFVWNDDLEEFVRGAPVPTRQALNGAADLIRAERKDPTALGISFDAEGNVVFDKVPSMRAFDYVKRSFDGQIGKAIKDGDRNLARILSGELNALKDGIARSNPDYAEVLKTQRDAFQQLAALEMGTEVLKKTANEPRQVMREYAKLTPEQKVEWRVGVVDALQQLDTKADPVAAYRRISRSPSQQKVWHQVFGEKFDDFNKFIEAETKSTRADNVTARGRQSITHWGRNANEQELGDDLAEVGGRAVQGAAFGGKVGFFSNALRGLQGLASKPSLATQEEIIKILMSKGYNLKAGTQQAARYRAAREARRMQRSVNAAKGAQNLVTSQPSE